MKKYLSLLMALVLMLCLAACSGSDASSSSAPSGTANGSAPAGGTNDASSAPAPVAEEVRGVTIPEFSVLVNGIEVTHASMSAYPVYSVQSTSVNSTGTESATTYVGFALKDVLEAAGLTDSYVWIEAAASDGYSVVFTGDIIYEDTTLLAITKDGSPFSASPWFAPCSDTTTGNYLKGAVSILVNTSEGAPDIDVPAASGDAAGGDAAVGELPEILDRTSKVEFTPYSFLVNGVEVTNETLEGLSIYKISAAAANSNGETVVSDYTGYKLTDVLEACGVTGYTTVRAVANDGYETELSGELIDSDYTLVAIEKDKELGEDGTIWLAPCSEASTKSYCKLVVEIVAE